MINNSIAQTGKWCQSVLDSHELQDLIQNMVENG
jgi:hypothetical protein